MSKILIKILNESALTHIRHNLKTITEKIINNDNNDWVYSEFEQPMFLEKKFSFEDFELEDNPDSNDKIIDFKNHIKIYESLNELPRYILSDERFWLWLELDKFYLVSKRMMKINGISTIHDHWMFGQGFRRGLFFGVLSRCYFRVDLTIDDSLEDKYELTKWIVEKPERFRNLTWRSFSSEKHLVRGIIKGEKKAVEEMKTENPNAYAEIAKFISVELGSVGLLDAYSEEDIANVIYDKMIEILKNETIC